MTVKKLKRRYKERRHPDISGKLHIYCPHPEETGINIHVVLKGGYCYRSEVCKVISCKYNRVQADMKAMLSLVW